MSVYLNDWAEEKQMLSDFGIDKSALDGAEVLVASYTYEDYSGSAFVLFERGGKLFEVHGSHCSCHGLSESDYCGDKTSQWQPEEVPAEALLHRINNGQFYEEDNIKNAVLAALSKHFIRRRAMSDTVWIGYRDNGYEGKSEPLRAFSTKELAELWKVGAADNFASGAEIIELPVINATVAPGASS